MCIWVYPARTFLYNNPSWTPSIPLPRSRVNANSAPGANSMLEWWNSCALIGPSISARGPGPGGVQYYITVAGWPV